MAGSVLYKDGRHWSRHSVTEIKANTNARLIRSLHLLTDYRVRESNLTELLRAVAWAGHHHHQATRCILPTKPDSVRQLKAMLKLRGAELEKAIENCDRATRHAIAEAENSLPQITWVNTHSEVDGLVIQVLSPESIRDSISLALSNIESRTMSRGPKEKPYQLGLIYACLKVWHEHFPPKASRCLDFCRAVFDAAGIPLGDKSLEALLTKARKGRIK